MTTAIVKRGFIESLIGPMFRNETSTLSAPQRWLIDALGGSKTQSGQTVNAHTAMGIITYFACIRNISEDLAKFPKGVFETLQPRGRKRRGDDPRDRLISVQPNPEMGAFAFHETMTSHALGMKGGLAEIVRDGAGQPRELWPICPQDWELVRLNPTRELRFRVHVAGVPDVFLRLDQVLYIHGLGLDGVTQYALHWLARESLGATMAARNFGAAWFNNNAEFKGVLQIPAGFQEPAMENLRKSWSERHESSDNAGRTPMLEEGVTWQSVSSEPQKSQMLETMEFNVEEVCRLFRCPPEYVGHYKRAQGWSTREQAAADVINRTLMGWIRRWEEEYLRKLFRPTESALYVNFNVNGELRGETEKRAAFYQSQMAVGALSPNDIRELEDMNPIPDGDNYFISQNVQPIKIALNPPEPEPKAPPNEPAKPDDKAKRLKDIAAAHGTLLAEEFGRVLQVEARKVKQAARDNSFDALEREFYADTADKVFLAIDGVIESFVVAAGGSKDDKRVLDFVKAIAARHVAESKAQMRHEQNVTDWTNGVRARADAAAAMNQLLKAMGIEP